jgi:phosphoenolpyruvate carboxylase
MSERHIMKIPRIVSTQHPDNFQLPFFAESRDWSGDDEIQEAYYSFSHLGCDKQMSDCEGTGVDDFVVRKLLFPSSTPNSPRSWKRPARRPVRRF